MTSPADLIDLLVTRLQGIPGLPDAFGGSQNIVALHSDPVNQSTLVQTITNMGVKCMVLWLGTLDNRTDQVPYAHHLGVIMRGKVDGDSLYPLIMNSEPESDGRKFRFVPLHPNIDSQDKFNCRRVLGVKGEPDYIEMSFYAYDIEF